MKKQAFTLIEILAVIAIVGVLAAVLFPVMSRAKREANKTASLSNLHQCAAALVLYADDEGGPMGMPKGSVAREVLAKMPTCDPGDRWRSGCRGEVGLPVIGSYGYVRGVTDFGSDAGWSGLLSRHPQPTLLASIHYSSWAIPRFSGDEPVVPTDTVDHIKAYIFPDRVLRVRMDLSAKSARLATIQEWPLGGYKVMFGWSALFDEMDREERTP